MQSILVHLLVLNLLYSPAVDRKYDLQEQKRMAASPYMGQQKHLTMCFWFVCFLPDIRYDPSVKNLTLTSNARKIDKGSIFWGESHIMSLAWLISAAWCIPIARWLTCNELNDESWQKKKWKMQLGSFCQGSLWKCILFDNTHLSISGQYKSTLCTFFALYLSTWFLDELTEGQPSSNRYTLSLDDRQVLSPVRCQITNMWTEHSHADVTITTGNWKQCSSPRTQT